MKRAASIILSAAMVLSLASCNLFISSSDNDSTKPSDTIPAASSEQNNDVVSDIGSSETMALTFDEVIAATVAGFGSEYSDFLNLQLMDPSDADVNKVNSIKNYVHIWHSESWTKDIDGRKNLNVDIYLFEVDITSDIYKDLKAGGKINYICGKSKENAAITAINGQYVLSICASEEKWNGDKTEQTLPDFSISTCQTGYEEFINLKAPSKTTGSSNAYKLNASLMTASSSIYGKFELGSGKHTEFGFMKPDSRNKNRERGIVDCTIGWIIDSDKSTDYSACKLLIFEMDMSSEQYKNYSVGDYIFFDEYESLNAAKITAINGQFILCLIASEYKDRNLVSVQTSPEFKSEDAKIIYETFTGLT